MKIYLAGAITGVSYSAATKWRNKATKLLKQFGHEVFNPMAGKGELQDSDCIPLDTGHLYDPQGIYEDDMTMLCSSDVLLVNLEGPISRGTMFEVGWAIATKRDVVFFNIGELEKHPFIGGVTEAHCVSSLEDAIEYLDTLEPQPDEF